MLVGGALIVAACSSSGDDSRSGESALDGSESANDSSVIVADVAQTPPYRYPDAPDSPAADEPTPDMALEAIDRLTLGLESGMLDAGGVTLLAQNGDARHAWYISDLMRFFGPGEGGVLVDSFEELTGESIDDDPASGQSTWLSVTNHLIAWDTPDYPNYQEDKSGLFLLIEPGWEPFFADTDAAIDWRYVSWGGVLIDARELGDTRGCPNGCIPALDDPAVTDADGGDWYPDDALVFGLVEGDETLAIPKNIAEVHEMFNLTLGDRRIGLPYCTLCGSAQAYYTDNTDADEQPVLRTTGLLSRSNKVMYDLRTSSVFDTFTGAAVSGPLQDQEIVLEQTTIVVSTWGEWKEQHPNTLIIAEDGGVGRTYSLDPLAGRDDNGPIFPIGSADDRLTVQEVVVGVISADDVAVAFPSDQAVETIAAGKDVVEAGVRLLADGDGIRAVDADTGDAIASHESFWFAWSQFHPDTELWLG
jgi:hypothetical protein